MHFLTSPCHIREFRRQFRIGKQTSAVRPTGLVHVCGSHIDLLDVLLCTECIPSDGAYTVLRCTRLHQITKFLQQTHKVETFCCKGQHSHLWVDNTGYFLSPTPRSSLPRLMQVAVSVLECKLKLCKVIAIDVPLVEGVHMAVDTYECRH
ncbi:hypothetical protein BDZ97DRAFT_1772566 [Flammula alnicola]|nr:hypothetical protein BDZ97DRAFT_1772566 [Flammula alnicola]